MRKGRPVGLAVGAWSDILVLFFTHPRALQLVVVRLVRKQVSNGAPTLLFQRVRCCGDVAATELAAAQQPKFLVRSSWLPVLLCRNI